MVAHFRRLLRLTPIMVIEMLPSVFFCNPSDSKDVFIYSIPTANFFFQVDVYRQQAPDFVLSLTVTLACFYSCEPVL